MIVPARTGGAGDERSGITLFLVEKNAPGLAVERMIRVDHRNAAQLRLDGVACGPEAIVGTLGEGAALLEAVVDRATVVLAAEMLGGMSEVFERTLRLVLGNTIVVNDATFLSGPWTATFSDTAKNSGGRATLYVSASRANLLLTPDTRPPCALPFPPPGELIASDLPITASVMRGAYQFAVCGRSVTGTLQLTKP